MINRQTGYYQLGWAYLNLNQHEKQSLNLRSHWKYLINGKIKPMWGYSYTSLGWAYHETGQYKKEKKLYKKQNRISLMKLI